MTKWIELRALRNKSAEEVISGLESIFFQRGSPKIVQSDNGREFDNQRMEEFLKQWDCKFVHGKPRHPASQGSVERGNGDIKVSIRNNSIF